MIARGEVLLEHATRSFFPHAGQARTLKSVVFRHRASAPPPEVHALKDVTLRIAPGETVGLVGRNGAGKTSTLKVLAGIIPLQSGRVAVGGRAVSVLELGAGFSRDLTGRENALLTGALYGLARADMEARLPDILAFSELGDFVDAPVRTYSWGMFVRLGFAIAAHLDADVLLIDEVLTVGDEFFQRKCLRKISEHIARGATLVLVSHEAAQIEQVCDRVIVLDGGEVRWDGPTAGGIAFYRERVGAGDVPAQVAGLRLEDGQGRVRSAFETGEAMRVVLDLAEPGEVLLEVREEGGALAFRTRDRVEETGPVHFEIERLNLLGGSYTLRVEPGGTLGFTVAAEAGVEGVADLRGAWRAAGVEVAPS